MKKLTLLFFTLFSSNFILNAISNNDSTSIKDINNVRSGNNYLGINAGFTTGVGISYIYMPKKNGFQITFLPLIDKDEAYISMGATYLRTIKKYNNSTFFIFWGNHFSNFFNDEKYYFNTGFGPGLHYYYDDFVINFMIGYGIYLIPDNISSRPTIEIGTFYRF